MLTILQLQLNLVAKIRLLVIKLNAKVILLTLSILSSKSNKNILGIVSRMHKKSSNWNETNYRQPYSFQEQINNIPKEMLCRNQQLNLWWNEKIGVK